MKRKSFLSAALLAGLLVLQLVVPLPATAQNTLNYHEQGGDTWVVDGTLRLHGVNLGVGRGSTYYVDSDTAVCSNNNNGKSWSKPWCTVVYALTQVASYDVIRITGSINESVTIPYAKTNLRIIGSGPHPRGAKWKYPTGGAPLITCNSDGFVLANVFLEAPSDSTAVKLVRSVGQTTARCNNAVIVGVEIWTGKYGVELAGAPHNVRILDSTIRNLRASGATAIYVSSTADALPFRATIRNNILVGNVNHLVGAFSDSVIEDNKILSAATGASTTTKIDLRGGSNNLLGQNVLGGTYSNAGGYYAGTSDEWVGNLIAGGLTTANPS